jgi:hypothetical protein
MSMPQTVTPGADIPGMVESAVIDPRQGFEVAFKALCEAADFGTAEIQFFHAMENFYSLYELAKKPPSSPASRDAALAATDEGKIAAAIVWARKFRLHESVGVSQTADLFSNYYPNLFGILAWRPRSDFTSKVDGRGWHNFYDDHLEGRPVLDTLQTAVSAVTAMINGC